MVVQKVPFKKQVVNMRKAEWRIGNTQKNGMAVVCYYAVVVSFPYGQNLKDVHYS